MNLVGGRALPKCSKHITPTYHVVLLNMHFSLYCYNLSNELFYFEIFYMKFLFHLIFHLYLLICEVGMELLHEAAFGTSDSGCGLGYSLISPADRIGSHSINQINEYHSRGFVGEKCVLGIVHPHPDLNGMDILKKVKSSIHLNPAHQEIGSGGYGFVGGEVYLFGFE